MKHSISLWKGKLFKIEIFEMFAWKYNSWIWWPYWLLFCL